MSARLSCSLLTPSVLQRFWSKIAIGESSACWPWKAGVDKDGYGKFQGYLGGSGRHLHLRARGRKDRDVVLVVCIPHAVIERSKSLIVLPGEI